jgi:hypothetical protein
MAEHTFLQQELQKKEQVMMAKHISSLQTSVRSHPRDQTEPLDQLQAWLSSLTSSVKAFCLWP